MRNIDAGLRFLHNRAAPPPAAMDYKGQELSEALYQYIIFAAMVRPSAGVGSASWHRCVLRACRRACKAARLTNASAPPCAPTPRDACVHTHSRACECPHTDADTNPTIGTETDTDIHTNTD